MIDTALLDAFDHATGYLDTCSYGLPARSTVAAMHHATEDWARGGLDLPAIDHDMARIRAAYARIVGAQAEDVALAGSTAQVTGMVAASLPDGARVLVAEGDFTSVGWPFRADPRLTVETVPLERLADAIGPQHDLVAVSAVQSRDGRIADLDALASQAHAHGVATVIDASQAAGWLPLAAHRFDVVVTSAYKWLTAPRGITLTAVSPGARWLRPVHANWYAATDAWTHLYGDELELAGTARRFDTSPPWPLVAAAAEALELMASVPVHVAHAHAAGLANQFRAAVGLDPSGSAIVSMRADAPPDGTVKVAQRDGRVRLGFHVYNDASDVDRAVAALRATPALV